MYDKVNKIQFSHSYKNVNIETPVEPAVLRTYIENQAILRPILLYRHSNCKQSRKEQEPFCAPMLRTKLF